MKDLKMYSESDRQEAIVNFHGGLKLKCNGEDQIIVKEGDRVTLVGEFTIVAAKDATNAGAELRQFVFTFGDRIYSVYAGYVEILPIETLRERDLVRLTWKISKTVRDYRVCYNMKQGYYLSNLATSVEAFANGYDSATKLLKGIKESPLVKTYEILPYEEFTVGAVKR
jgi:hypothetical protein